MAGMLRPQHLCARAPSDIVFEHEVAGIEVALWTDPDPISDDTPAIEATLKDGLFSKEHTIANLECFRMDEAHVLADVTPEPIF